MLKTKARSLGADEEAIDVLDDADDIKAAAIELILKLTSAAEEEAERLQQAREAAEALVRVQTERAQQDREAAEALARVQAERVQQAREAASAAGIPQNKHMLDLVVTERYLRDIAEFAELSDAKLRDVARALEIHTFKSGEVLIRKGQVGTSFFLLKSGTVGFIVEDGGDVKHTFDQAGDHFGEIALLKDNTLCTATAKTATGCECYVLDKSTFDE